MREEHFPAEASCLSLWERWHGEAVTERVFYAASSYDIGGPSPSFFCPNLFCPDHRKGDRAVLRISGDRFLIPDTTPMAMYSVTMEDPP